MSTTIPTVTSVFPKVSKTAHRFLMGASSILGLLTGAITIYDPSAFGVDVDVKVAVLGGLAVVSAIVNFLRMATDPAAPAPAA